MKNWQQRWFVLRGDQLFYYKDKDESKPQVRHGGPGSRGCPVGEWKEDRYSSLALNSLGVPISQHTPASEMKCYLLALVEDIPTWLKKMFTPHARLRSLLLLLRHMCTHVIPIMEENGLQPI